jgi:hypothetical protein
MPKEQSERRPATDAQRKAGRENIAEFNASRCGKPALTHGIHSLITHGELPPGREAIAERVDGILAEMVSDLGGETEVTAQKRAILESQRLCLLVLGLADGYIRTQGLLNERGKPHPLLASVVSFSNSLRLNALALGLERRPRKVESLHDVLAEYNTRGKEKADGEKQA